MAWTDTQAALVRALDAYLSADRATKIVGDKIEGQWRKADRLHGELLKLAQACGFEPHDFHRHLSTVDWASQQAAAFRRELPANAKEAGL